MFCSCTGARRPRREIDSKSISNRRQNKNEATRRHLHTLQNAFPGDVQN